MKIPLQQHENADLSLKRFLVFLVDLLNLSAHLEFYITQTPMQSTVLISTLVKVLYVALN